MAVTVSATGIVVMMSRVVMVVMMPGIELLVPGIILLLMMSVVIGMRVRIHRVIRMIVGPLCRAAGELSASETDYEKDNGCDED